MSSGGKHGKGGSISFRGGDQGVVSGKIHVLIDSKGSGHKGFSSIDLLALVNQTGNQGGQWSNHGRARYGGKGSIESGPGGGIHTTTQNENSLARLDLPITVLIVQGHLVGREVKFELSCRIRLVDVHEIVIAVAVAVENNRGSDQITVYGLASHGNACLLDGHDASGRRSVIGTV